MPKPPRSQPRCAADSPGAATAWAEAFGSGACVRRTRPTSARRTRAAPDAGARADWPGTPRQPRVRPSPRRAGHGRGVARRAHRSRARHGDRDRQRAARAAGAGGVQEPPPAVGDAGVPGPSTSEAPSSPRPRPRPAGAGRAGVGRHRASEPATTPDDHAGRSGAAAEDARGAARRARRARRPRRGQDGGAPPDPGAAHPGAARLGGPAQPRAHAPPRVRRQPGNGQDHGRPARSRDLPGRRPAPQGSPRRVRPLRARRRLRRPDRDQDRRGHRRPRSAARCSSTRRTRSRATISAAKRSIRWSRRWRTTATSCW